MRRGRRRPAESAAVRDPAGRERSLARRATYGRGEGLAPPRTGEGDKRAGRPPVDKRGEGPARAGRRAPRTASPTGFAGRRTPRLSGRRPFRVTDSDQRLFRVATLPSCATGCGRRGPAGRLDGAGRRPCRFLRPVAVAADSPDRDLSALSRAPQPCHGSPFRVAISPSLGPAAFPSHDLSESRPCGRMRRTWRRVRGPSLAGHESDRARLGEAATRKLRPP